MISYPNQKKYHINKKIEEGDVFIMLKWEDFISAARNLSPSALKLFMYLAKNQDRYEMWFSSKDYCQTFEVSDKTFRNARRELLDKGYIKEGQNNHVYFSTTPIYKISKENLQKRLKEIGSKIELNDKNRFEDFLIQVRKADLRNIQDKTEYMNKIEKLIKFGENILEELGPSQFNGLL